jgi:ribosomal protein S27AE
MEAQIKQCRICKEIKNFDFFSKDSRSRDRKHSECKKCASERHKLDKEANPQKQIIKWWNYSIKNEEKLREKSREYRKNSNGKEVSYRAQYRIDFAPKVMAKSKISSLLSKGVIVRKPCEICGAEKVDAHHDDYAKPLDVRWLCRRHHSTWHAENGEAPNGRAALAAVGVEP